MYVLQAVAGAGALTGAGVGAAGGAATGCGGVGAVAGDGAEVPGRAAKNFERVA